MGLCAGDRNGGPIRMALKIASSLIENRGFSRSDIINRYKNWYLGPPFDPEKSFDTGETFQKIFRVFTAGGDIEKIANEVNSFGVNSCHRAIAIPCYYGFSNDEILNIVHQEGTITHTNDIAIQASKAYVSICRYLILGYSIEESLKKTQKLQCITEWGLMNILRMETRELHQLSKDGNAIVTLEAALWFLIHTKDFTSALHESLEFAGSNNYCPVLVGAMAGSYYGFHAIQKEDYEHEIVIERVSQESLKISDLFAAEWPENVDNEF